MAQDRCCDFRVNPAPRKVCRLPVSIWVHLRILRPALSSVAIIPYATTFDSISISPVIDWRLI